MHPVMQLSFCVFHVCRSDSALVEFLFRQTFFTFLKLNRLHQHNLPPSFSFLLVPLHLSLPENPRKTSKKVENPGKPELQY